MKVNYYHLSLSSQGCKQVPLSNVLAFKIKEYHESQTYKKRRTFHTMATKRMTLQQIQV